MCTGAPFAMPLDADLQALLADLREAATERAGDAAAHIWARMAAMSPGEALDYALLGSPPAPDEAQAEREEAIGEHATALVTLAAIGEAAH